MDDEPHHTHDRPPASAAALPSLAKRLLSGSIDIESRILRKKGPNFRAIPATPATPSNPVQALILVID
jgi:hypothetical protein